MGAGISKIKDFNPVTWGDTSNGDDTPIKAIIGLILDLFKLVDPIISLSENGAEVITNTILSNKFIIEFIIVLLPSIPILYLLNYFMDTL